MKKLIAATLLITGISCHVTIAQPENKSKGYQIGDVVADFSLQNVDEKMYRLSEIEDAKGYIIIFMSNTCPVSNAYESRIIALHNEMVQKGYPVVALNSNDPEYAEGDSFEGMKLKASEERFPFLYLKDGEQVVLEQFGATKTPEVFLLDSDFKLQYTGAIDDSAHDPDGVEKQYLKDAIHSLASGDLPNPSKTRSVGCGIKTKETMASGHGRPGRGGPPSADQILEMMDKDKDEKVSLAEAQGPLKRDFSRLDKNEDEYLTREELSQIPSRGRPQN